MANQIAIDVYEFGIGMDLNGIKYSKGFMRENIVSFDPVAIYNHKREHVSAIKSKIVANEAGLVKEYHVAQTVAQIKTLLDA